MSDNLLSRFLRYVRVDTQSDETSNTFPSTPDQLVLLEMLKQELSELGAADVQMTKHGYVMASVPANTRKARVGRYAGHDVAMLCHLHVRRSQFTQFLLQHLQQHQLIWRARKCVTCLVRLSVHSNVTQES